MLHANDLHPYQRHCVEHICKTPHCALFLDMGLGKTVSTLTAIETLLNDEYAITRVLIIAPKRVAQSTWSDELSKWSHLSRLTLSKILGTETQRRHGADADADLYVINRENIAWLVANYAKRWRWDCIVIDELSSFKSHSSQRFRALKLVRAKARRIIGLTGTPTPNGMHDLWAQMFLIDGGERLGKTIGAYRREYFTEGRRSAQVVFDYKLRGGAEEQIRQRLADIAISMSKEDYLTLPDCITQDVPVTLSDAEYKRYKTFERSQVLELLGQEITAANAATLAGKLSQWANGVIYDEEHEAHELHDAKLDALREIVDVAPGNVLVAYAYQHDRARILSALRAYEPMELNSEEDLKRWNSGTARVLIGHPASMGHGLNIQAGGSVIVWFGLTWSLELYMQFNARLHRQGQDKPVIIHHLITRGTIDERIVQRLQDKRRTQDALMDAVRAIVEGYKGGGV